MFVVPLPGDSVQTEGGVKHTVLSYAAYKNQPAVYVETDGKTESVLFSDIQSINGTPVSLTPGKVFRADSLVKRKAQLPQPGDKITVGADVLKVKSLKLRKSGKLTDGMIVACETEAKEPVDVRLASIERLERADGDKSFKRATFFSSYSNYTGK
jgi:hypothetical protein